jgi:dTDP-4-dehydrorhamnose reductase
VGARGTVHVANSGECSWHALACAALATAGVQTPVERITSADLGAPAPRPAYSVLSTALFGELTGLTLRDWREALPEMVRA